MMEISIKSIGYKQGTSGWLKNGLNDGSITIKEGMSTQGKHGLWIHSGDTSMCLGLFDVFDYDGLYHRQTIAPRDNIDHDCTTNTLHLTDAVIAALYDVADEWCEKQNEAREQDEKPVLTAVYA